MKNKKTLQITISAILALAFVQFYLKDRESTIVDAYRQQEVLIATRDIPPRTEINTNHVMTTRIPQKFIAPGAIVVNPGEDALSRIKGKVTIIAIPEGSQIVLSSLMEPSVKDTGIAPKIPPGKRGYLLRLGNLDVANLILPGDHIDILATFTLRQDTKTMKMTNTILQNILVVAVGREMKAPGPKTANASKDPVESLVLTLALEPLQAQIMALAQSESQGEISVVIRPHGEHQVNPIRGVTPGTLLR